jgi:O-antigen/teichoic acid export membrane protein
LVVKTYGPATFGLYLFGISLIELLLLLTKIGLDRSAIRAIASLNASEQTVEIKGVVRSAIKLMLPCGLFVSVLLLACDGWLADALGRPGLATFLSIAAPAVPLSLLADAWLWATEGIGLQLYFALIRMGSEPLVKLTLTVILLWVLGSNSGVRSLGLAYTASIVVAALLAYLVYRRVIVSRAPGRPARSYTGELLRVGWPTAAQTGIGRLLGQADIFLIFTFVSAAATARYAVALRTATLIATIAYAFEAAFRPAVAHHLATSAEGQLQALFRSISRSVLMLCLPACLILLLFPERIMAVVGEQFADTGNIIRLITVGVLINLLVGPAGATLIMAGRTKISFVNSLLAGITGLALNLLLIPRLGVIGAGIAQCVSTLIFNTLSGVAVRRRFNLFAIGRHHLPLLVAALMAGGAAGLAGSLPLTNKYAALAVIGSATVMVYAATLFLIGIAPEDRHILRILLMPGKWLRVKPNEEVKAQPGSGANGG